MVKSSSFLVSTFLLISNLTNGEQLRVKSSRVSEERLAQRLDALELIVQKQQITISVLEQTIEEHVQSIANLQTRRLENVTAAADMDCQFHAYDGYCELKADLVVTGKTKILDGLDVEAGDCDNCINFHDDVYFDDNVKFNDPVIFEDPVKFTQDVTIQGMEIPSSVKSIKTSDTTYTSLDFKTTEYGKIKFDQDKKFVVTSATRFEKNMDIKLPSSPSSDATEPNLFVEGNLGVAGVIVN